MGNGKLQWKKVVSVLLDPAQLRRIFSVTEACRRQLQSVSFTFKVRVFC